MANNDYDENWDDLSIKDFGDLQKFAYVTLKAIDAKSIGFCYREYSDIKIDSGWRFLFGDEDEDYLDNPDNVVAQSLSEILTWKPEIKDVITGRYRSEYEWDESSSKFVEI